MNPDERNEYDVRVYFNSNAKHTFPAKDLHNAREIAKRVITEGVHIINHPYNFYYNEIFYPVHQVYKVKIIEM